MNDKEWEAKACEGLGDLAITQKKMPLAREWFVKAEGLYREIGDTKHADDLHDVTN